jgi:hypothetical protein
MMALRHAAALVAAFILCASEPALAQNAPITNTPKIITPPAALPDLAISKFQATPVCMPNGSTTVTIKVTLTNVGKAKADLSHIPYQMIVSADWWPVTYDILAQKPPQDVIAAQASGPKSLAPGESWPATLTVSGIPAMKKKVNPPGAHGVMTTIDQGNKLSESDEFNNNREYVFYDVCAYVN